MADSPSEEGENVFLVSIDPENFERTVSSPVDFGDSPERPAALDGLDSVRLWGAPEGSRNVETFERMQSGDLLLFYADGEYVGVGRVARTFEDEAGWASETLWSDFDSTHLFTVTDFTPVDIGRASVNALFEYSPTYVPQGLMRVAPDRVTARLSSIALAMQQYDEQRA